MTGYSPEALAEHYQYFDVTSRTLLTGHSHQAWPDVGRQAQLDAWQDAATYVDDKWSHAFEKAERVKQGFASLIGETNTESIVLAANTHDLLVRFLSALSLAERPRIITTDGEFHSMRRQLTRLAEEGIEVVRVPVDPIDTLAERISAQVNSGAAAVMMSAVMFKDAGIVRDLELVSLKCSETAVPFLVDAYHAINVMPFDIRTLNIEQSYVVGGGYKYCQLGEGNCFMRVPADCELRPVITGWYAEFSELEGNVSGVPYPKGADRFQGSTYDPTSHYRAAAVFDFFGQQQLTPVLLREISQHQVGLLIRTFDELDLDSSLIKRPRKDLAETGGFLSLRTSMAERLCVSLRKEQVFTDYRDDCIRLGPAPYVTDDQLINAMRLLADLVR